LLVVSNEQVDILIYMLNNLLDYLCLRCKLCLLLDLLL